ncbi:hypothetical protein [Candidatus Planktophila dulcis]|uniref:hypothetical protein n=1 Tax=Candidatus Planktophila dulcis TaxID=1884914 RepID=UPI003BEEFB8E
MIGIGIVGQIALEELSHGDLKIVVIDEVNTTSELHFLRDMDGDKSVWTNGSRVAGYPGGRLNWGKNCSFVTIEGQPPLGDELQSHLPNLSKRLRKYGFPKLNLVELKKLGQDKFYVRESQIFFPEIWIKNVESLQNVKIISGLATEILEESNGLVRVLVRQSGDSTKEIYAKKVIVCAGPFGTQELLANSGLISEISPRIWDHISFSIGSIPLRKVGLTKFGLFGWNRFQRINVKRCSTYYDKINNIFWTLRVFPEGIQSLGNSLLRLKKVIRNGEYGSCFSLIGKLAASFITGKLLFEEIEIHISADFMDESSAIKSASYGEGERIDYLTYQDKSIPISEEFERFIAMTVENLQLDLKNQLSLNLRGTIEFTEITSSSHHMGTLWNSDAVTQTSPIEISQNIFAAGSAIFRTSVPGHPTMLAAATSIIAADRIKSQLS